MSNVSCGAIGFSSYKLLNFRKFSSLLWEKMFAFQNLHKLYWLSCCCAEHSTEPPRRKSCSAKASTIYESPLHRTEAFVPTYLVSIFWKNHMLSSKISHKKPWEESSQGLVTWINTCSALRVERRTKTRFSLQPLLSSRLYCWYRVLTSSATSLWYGSRTTSPPVGNFTLPWRTCLYMVREYHSTEFLAWQAILTFAPCRFSWWGKYVSLAHPLPVPGHLQCLPRSRPPAGV